MMSALLVYSASDAGAEMCCALRNAIVGIGMACAICAGSVLAADAAGAGQLPAATAPAAGQARAASAPATNTPAQSAANGAVRSVGGDQVTLNFVNAEIEGVVKVVSEITGKNFVLDPRVKGTVNIISSKPLAKALVYDVFLSALRMQGFAAIEGRGTVNIVPEGDVKLYQSPTYGPQDRPRAGNDEVQTQVFTLKYEAAAQLVPVLRPLIAPNNTITAHQSSNSLIITDYAGNLQRLEKIISSLDQPSGADGMVIPLRYASATDVAQTVNRFFAEAAQAQGAADPSQSITIIADVRANSLLARSNNPSRLARLRSLVSMLDVETSAAGNMHVVYLKNAEAVKVAETLRAIYQGNAAVGAVRPAVPTGGALSAPTTLGAAAAAPGQPQGAAAVSFAGTGQVAVSAPGIIQADAATNSIIITAPDAIYNDLRAVLEKLDVRRAQVYVEALIAEITAAKAAEFGIQWQDLNGLGSSRSSAFGGTNFGTSGQNILGISQNPASAGVGLNVGVVKGTVTIPGTGVQLLNLGLLVRALETDSNANILSTPTLLTLDNEEATIVVGQNVPFITGQYAVSSAATTPTPFQTIERRDVGLVLKLKPQISQGGLVRLQIYEEVSSVQDQSNAAGVITNKRSMQSTVLVDDGQIVVIGGLMQDSVTDGVQKVPLLGDLPLFGSLFRYKTRSQSKTNLMVFLRPVVLRDGGQADRLTNDRYDYILGEQRKVEPVSDGPLPYIPSPSLPPRPATAANPAPAR